LVPIKITIRRPEKEIVDKLRLAATRTISIINKLVSDTVRANARTAIMKMPNRTLFLIPSLKVI
jgi:hypothetical protein